MVPNNPSGGGGSRSCLWGNYVMATFACCLVAALLFEYRDMTRNTSQVITTTTSSSSSSGISVVEEADVHFHDHVTQCAFLSDAKKALKSAQQRIETDWNMTSYPLFYRMMHIPTLSWDIQKAKFVKLLLEYDEISVDSARPSFVVGFTGSSVTAGHDNYFSEAYPQVFYEAMKPVFDSLKVNFTVRNQALGNNPCYPYDACVETHVGDDVDIITWEQSMNCGRDAKPVDTFTRTAYHLPKRPTVIYVLSGTPTWSPTDCDKLNITNTTTRPILASNEVELMQTPLKSIVQRSGNMAGYAFLRNVHDRYLNAALMSQEVFPIQAYKCYGPYTRDFATKTLGGGAAWHPGRLGHKIRGDNLAFMLLAILEDAIDSIGDLACTTGFADVDSFDRSKLDSLPHLKKLLSSVRRQRRSLSSTAAALTPTTTTNVAATTPSATTKQASSPTASLRTAAAITLTASAVHETTQGVVQDIQLAFNLTDTFSKQVSFNKHILAFADQKFSSNSPLTMKDVKMVLHHMMHQYAADYLHAQYSPAMPPVPAEYDVAETNFPSQCYTDYLPRVKNALEDIVLSPQGNWTKELSFFDVNGVRKGEQLHLGYLDRKILHISHEMGAAISFHIKVQHENPVWICECQKGFLQYPAYMTDLSDGADVHVQYHVQARDGSHHSQPRVDAKKAKKVDILLLKDQCYRTAAKLPAGEHILTVTQKGSKQINIAYIVTW